MTQRTGHIVGHVGRSSEQTPSETTWRRKPWTAAQMYTAGRSASTRQCSQLATTPRNIAGMGSHLAKARTSCKLQEQWCLRSAFSAWRAHVLAFSEAGVQTSVGLSLGRALVGMPDFGMGPYAETGVNHLELRLSDDLRMNAGRSTGADTSGPYTELYVELARQHSRSGMCVGCDLAGPFVNVYVSSATDTKGACHEIKGVTVQDLKDAAVLARDTADLIVAQASGGGTSTYATNHSATSSTARVGAELPHVQSAVFRKVTSSFPGGMSMLQRFTIPHQGPLVAGDKT